MKSTGIDTSEGFIPHHHAEGLWLTVRLQTERVIGKGGYAYQRIVMDSARRPAPMRMSDGALIYVLPGGEDYV